jgi:acetylornithine deacetylase/succinyl-diaminopimelate desuccinylase-like protein
MKAGSWLAVDALHRIAAAGLLPPRPIVVYLNSDEEIGSYTSRGVIEELSRNAAFVMVPEPAFEAPGTVVTKRKGWGRFVLRAHGRSAHAGGNLFDGRSAILEVARHIIDIEAMTATETHATFNVGTVHGGTRPNVVPAEAVIEIDMRADDMATAERLTAAMLARTSYNPDVRIEVEGVHAAAPGARRVLESALAALLGERLRRARVARPAQAPRHERAEARVAQRVLAELQLAQPLLHAPRVRLVPRRRRGRRRGRGRGRGRGGGRTCQRLLLEARVRARQRAAVQQAEHARVGRSVHGDT